MRPSNRFALKEWAVVCAALASGRQTLLFRKGGIAEGRDGFTLDHNEFWLFPTQFHQNPDQLNSDSKGLLDRVQHAIPPAGEVHIDLYAVVSEVERISDQAEIEGYESRQILTRETVLQRFHYREPGLFVVEVAIHRLSQPHVIAADPAFAGCHSWVDLGTELATAGVRRVMEGS